MKCLAVLTSGGDAPGMNSAVRALVKLAAGKGVRVRGVENGYEGLMEGRFRDLTCKGPHGLRSNAEVDTMGSLGGTVLGSARSQKFRTEEGRKQASDQLKGVDALVVIGGNGSLAGAHCLHEEHGIRVIGIPASIDNDIGCTSMAIGVDTALNTIVEACDRISDTARAHRRAFIVEVMGRDCGYLAMASSVAAGADAVLFREQGRTEEQVIEAVVQTISATFTGDEQKRRVLIIKSEGVAVPSGRIVEAATKQLAALDLPALRGVDVRCTVLGHLVRGGPPSYFDRMIAGRLAFSALACLSDGATSDMVAWQPVTPGGVSGRDPSVEYFSLAQVLKETESLLDGTSEITKRRVAMLEGVRGVLGL